jgi:hypothetical protein
MQHEIVKEQDFYVIVVEGQRMMKFRSRRKAARLLSAVLAMSDPARPEAPVAVAVAVAAAR